jgi:hypothetical protein
LGRTFFFVMLEFIDHSCEIRNSVVISAQLETCRYSRI